MRHRKDLNHDEIKNALEAIYGVDVIDTSQCGVPGFPDLCVGSIYTNKLMLVEIKGKHGKLNADQKRFHAKHPKYCCVVRTVDEARELVGDPSLELPDKLRSAGL